MPPVTVTRPLADTNTVCRRDRSAVRALRPSLSKGRSPAQAPVTSAGVEPGRGPGVDGPEQVVDVLGGAVRGVERAVVVGVGGPDVGEPARSPVRPGGLSAAQGTTKTARRSPGTGRAAAKSQGSRSAGTATWMPLAGRSATGLGSRCGGQIGDLLGPDSAGVDDHFGPDLGAVGQPSAGEPATVVEESCDRGVVGDDRTVSGRRSGHRQGEAGVVGLGVPVEEGGGQAVRAQDREMATGLRPRRCAGGACRCGGRR